MYWRLGQVDNATVSFTRGSFVKRSYSPIENLPTNANRVVSIALDRTTLLFETYEWPDHNRQLPANALWAIYLDRRINFEQVAGAKSRCSSTR